MFKIYNWKETIYKKDLIAVIINGLLTALLVGMLAGALDFLFYKINFSLSIGLLLLCYTIAYRVRKAYFNFHILYPVLAVIFLLFGIFVEMLTNYCFIYGSITQIFNILSSWNFYFNYLTFPIYGFIRFYNTSQIAHLFGGILDLIFYVFSIIVCFKFSGGKLK